MRIFLSLLYFTFTVCGICEGGEGEEMGLVRGFTVFHIGQGFLWFSVDVGFFILGLLVSR